MTPPRGLGPIRASVCFPAQSRRCSSTPHSVTLDPSFGEICNSTLQGQFSTPKSANEKGSYFGATRWLCSHLSQKREVTTVWTAWRIQKSGHAGHIVTTCVSCTASNERPVTRKARCLGRCSADDSSSPCLPPSIPRNYGGGMAGMVANDPRQRSRFGGS